MTERDALVAVGWRRSFLACFLHPSAIRHSSSGVGSMIAQVSAFVFCGLSTARRRRPEPRISAGHVRKSLVSFKPRGRMSVGLFSVLPILRFCGIYLELRHGCGLFQRSVFFLRVRSEDWGMMFAIELRSRR